MARHRKRKPIKLIIRKETIFSIASVTLILLGVLIMISFSGQGMILATINSYLIRKFGLSMFFLPFICISAGMVLFQTKWAWSKPHILLGVILTMIGALGILQSGEIGLKTFFNVAALVTPYGAYAIFTAFVASGIFIMLQISIAEILEFFAGILPKKQYRPAPMAQQEELPSRGGFNMPKLNLGFGKKPNQGFSVNDPSQKMMPAGKMGNDKKRR